jgi:hypothetical protein
MKSAAHKVPWRLVLLAMVTFVLLSLFGRTRMREDAKEGFGRMSLYSPEYAYPTKCFDCVAQESQNFWRVSHGNPRMFAGM